MFFKFINKFQGKIVPPSSHVCNFIFVSLQQRHTLHCSTTKFCCDVPDHTLFYLKSYSSHCGDSHSSTQFDLTSARRSLTKLWYSACTSGSRNLHNIHFAAIKHGFSQGVWLLSTATSKLCCEMHSSFQITLTFLENVLLTGM